jgi:hypothetical protein
MGISKSCISLFVDNKCMIVKDVHYLITMKEEEKEKEDEDDEGGKCDQIA